ncbi:unnamed protein product [Urochloa humidicola]
MQYRAQGTRHSTCDCELGITQLRIASAAFVDPVPQPDSLLIALSECCTNMTCAWAWLVHDLYGGLRRLAVLVMLSWWL